MKLIIISTVLILLIMTGILLLISCSSFGNIPEGEHLSRITNSPNYDKSRDEFVNRRPELIEEMQKRLMNFGMVKEWMSGAMDRVPTVELPTVKTDMVEFVKESENVKIVWLGHSSVLMNISGEIILIDPVFSDNASPVSLMFERFQDTGISLEDLPEVDLIIISHDHYDHLDMKTVKFYKNKKVRFIAPLGVGSHLMEWGIDERRIAELDWYQDITVHGIKLTAAPSQHFSGRSLTKRNKTLWCSWVIKNEKQNLFFSGDSGYDIHFKEIGEKFGPFDLAFIENGQYNEKWHEVHMYPSETVQAYQDIKANKMIPIHWGMFELGLHSWYDPVSELHKEAEGKEINILTPKLGEILEISQDVKTEKWWQDLIPKK